MLFDIYILVALAYLPCVTTQTFSACNPLHVTNCPPDAALGKAINVDFTKGAVDSFESSGTPIYDDEGVHFTVAKSGDAPQLNSLFYIMFGKVSITMKSAPGAGIVSSLVLQSDTLDEIDIEWLGIRSSDLQTNYFGKGDTTTYDRGAFNSAPNHQNRFITYTVEWTSSQITWSVDGKVVRILTPSTSASNQYPQTPMQVKFGAWSGGDSANTPGTISWSGGPTDYSKGPFTMTVKSIAVFDYSTGNQYKYGDQSGTWNSILSIGGKINSNSGGSHSQTITTELPSVTSSSPSIPAGLGKDHDSTSTRTQWPWVPTSTLSASSHFATHVNGLPSGWVINSSGKVIPASSAATLPGSLNSQSSSTFYGIGDEMSNNPMDSEISYNLIDAKGIIPSTIQAKGDQNLENNDIESCISKKCESSETRNTSTSSAVKSPTRLTLQYAIIFGLIMILAR
ncbi:putative extracellular glycosidase [Erysiphe neolycopersici]|uniref:Crh-like protein n=1 Tax=Erysiphe neolycopersici TaxID=212602 RepID=A0A420HU75_9PEZI|nr:putative extracellular glycosidase [Erysiphe neolycopersici]